MGYLFIAASIIIGFVLNEINLGIKKPQRDKSTGKYIYMQPLFGFNFLLYRGKNRCTHIHHWIINLLFIIILLVVPKLSKNLIHILIGVNIGSFLQDMTYLMGSRKKIYMSPFQFNQECTTQLETYTTQTIDKM